MSCLHPITIKNRTKTYISGVTQMYFQVPCGNCEECRKARVQDWTTRAYAEVLDTLNQGGFTLFVTLTFDNAHLPHFVDGKYNIPCFNKDYVDRFLNSLRKFYERRNIFGIKYLITSEYGENTKRPHHHGLIHFPSGISRIDAIRQIEKYWTYGLVGWSESGREVVSYDGCRYVSKYILKDLYYLGRSDLKSYLNPNNIEYLDRLEKIKPYLPKHYQSKGYGESLKYNILNSENPFDELFNGYRIAFTDKVVPYPNYIKNKLCYEYLEDGRRILNEFGKNYKMDTFDEDISRNVIYLKKIISNDGLSSRIDDEDVLKLRVFEGCNNVSDLHEYLNYFMEENGFSLKDYVVYNKCFRGNISPDTSLEGYVDIPELSSYSYEGLYEQGKKLFNQRLQIDLSLLDIEDEEVIDEMMEYDEYKLYNCLPQFRVMEEFSCYIRFICGLHKKRVSDYEVYANKIIKKLQDLHNSYKYGF